MLWAVWRITISPNFFVGGKLSGIGESKAAQIISYREKNGAFKKIEDIMNITGIKEGVFGKIKDDITV